MARTYNFDHLEITWLGHSSFKIKIPPSEAFGLEFIVYIDPFQIKSGEKADLILVTHGHYDHKDKKSIELLKKETTEILIGGENIKEGEEKEIRGVKIKDCASL